MQRLMYDVLWCFKGKPFDTLAEFKQEVSQYQVRVRKIDSWKSEERILESPRISVQYMHWEGDHQVESIVDLTCDDGKGFSAGELLFKLHNAVVAKLHGSNHRFFEGLQLADGKFDHPLYFLLTGS